MSSDGDLTFRAATRKDRDIFIALGFQLRAAEGVPVQPGQEDYYRNRFAEFIDGWNWKVYFSIYQNELAGFVTFRYIQESGIRRNKVCFVQHLFVLDRFRRQGIGQRMMKWLETQCRLEKAEEIELFVLVNNDPARSFYGGIGFKDELVQMRKKL